MKTILWINPSECEKLYDRICKHNTQIVVEIMPPIRLTYTQGNAYDQAIILNYDTFKWLKEVGVIIVS